MRFATVGTSWITAAFISAAKKQGWELRAVYSRAEDSARAFAAKTGAPRIYTSLEDLAADGGIDTVYIASPNRFHFEQSLFFLERGKHVFCEKPLCTTEREAEALFAAAKARGVIIAEAMMSIHTPAFSLLREAIGKLGRVRTAYFDFCQLSSKYPAYLRGENPNIFNPAMHAGCLMDIGVYNVYLAAALFGEPTRVCSDATFLESGADAAGAALLSYPGLTVSLVYSKVGQQTAPSEIVGDVGSLTIASVSQLTGIERHTKEEKKILVPHDLTRDEVMGAEARFFEAAVKTGGGKDWESAKETCLIVRRILDTIRAQNGFPF